jgi:hypothetical protein
MSFLEAFRQGPPASQSAHIDRSVPAANPLNLSDHLRLRQMERMLQQTLEEIEQAKARISRVENALAEPEERYMTAGESSGQQASVFLTSPLPIAEISQLAEMAKRFK